MAVQANQHGAYWTPEGSMLSEWILIRLFWDRASAATTSATRIPTPGNTRIRNNRMIKGLQPCCVSLLEEHARKRSNPDHRACLVLRSDYFF